MEGLKLLIKSMMLNIKLTEFIEMEKKMEILKCLI